MVYKYNECAGLKFSLVRWLAGLTNTCEMGPQKQSVSSVAIDSLVGASASNVAAEVNSNTSY